MSIYSTRNRSIGKNLTEDEIAYIREQFDKGIRASDLARTLGCSSSTTDRWYQRFRASMPATRKPKGAHNPYELLPGESLCRYGDCMRTGSGRPPFCAEHTPVPAKPRTVLFWTVPPERLRAGR